MPYLPAYLQFIRLFNAQKFFEAHEVLELLWREEKGPDRDFYQGLIQIAAVFVHLQKNNLPGAQRLLETAAAYLKPYAPFCHGVLIEELLAAVRQALRDAPAFTSPKIQL